MSGLLGAAVPVIMRIFFPQKKQPTVEENLAASNATAQTELVQEEAKDEIITKASTARAAVDAALVSGSGPSDSVNTDPKAPVNESKDAHFRD